MLWEVVHRLVTARHLPRACVLLARADPSDDERLEAVREVGGAELAVLVDGDLACSLHDRSHLVYSSAVPLQYNTQRGRQRASVHHPNDDDG